VGVDVRPRGPAAAGSGARRAPLEEHDMSAGESRLPEPGDHSGEPGLGSALALTGLLAATKIAEAATGVVLSAAGLLSGTDFPARRAPAAPGGE
jgi:hypothetical protein